MAYEHLSKIFYKNNSSHAGIYAARFNSPATRHFNFLIREYNRQRDFPAFLCYSEEMFLQLERVYKKFELFSQAAHSIPPLALQQFALECIVEEVKSTNDLEGVRSTRREIREILEGTSKDSRLAGVVKNYNSLVSGAEFRFETCADIRSFYDEFALAEVIFSNKRNAPDGEIFRREPVEISTGTGKILHCGLYPESEIIGAMNVALAILNDGSTPFLPRIAAFHYFFEYIHPFYDGNGRTGRFIASYYLARHFNRFAALRLSVTIKKRQKKYYDLFKETNATINCGDLTPFALGFTAIIEETLDEAAAILKSATAKLEERGKSLRAELPNDELTQKIGNLLLQASVFFCGGLSMQELMTLTGASRNTIKSRLRQISGVEAIGVKKLFYRLKNSKE